MPCTPAPEVAMACAIATSRTDGYALPKIWLVVYWPPAPLAQSCVCALLLPMAQSHACVNAIDVQSLGVSAPVAGFSKWKVHANWRSFLLVFHSRPLMGSQLSLELGGQFDTFADVPSPAAVCPDVRGTIDSIMWKSAPVKL